MNRVSNWLPSVMAFLDDDKSNTRFIIGFELNTSFTDSCQFMLKYLNKGCKHNVDSVIENSCYSIVKNNIQTNALTNQIKPSLPETTL